MNIATFIEQLSEDPASVTFEDTVAVIDKAYAFTPVQFTNGEVTNEAGQNSGSCKLLAFGMLHQLTKEQMLACFGAYYREVLQHPGGSDHQNIRNFMKTGWSGVRFDQMPLQPKSTSG